jgi:hypothetical protein
MTRDAEAPKGKQGRPIDAKVRAAFWALAISAGFMTTTSSVSRATALGGFRGPTCYNVGDRR